MRFFVVLFLCAGMISSASAQHDDAFCYSGFSFDNQKDIYRILTVERSDDSAFLARRALPVEAADSLWLGRVASAMVRTVSHPSVDGAGLAGPQVGLSKRLIVVMRVDKPGRPFQVCVNPVITHLADLKHFAGEGCLSIPDIVFVTERYNTISVRYQLLDGQQISETVTGLQAYIFQHEIDHLDGILCNSRAIKL